MSHDKHEISRDCPIDCLKAVLSGEVLNPLARAYKASFDAPRTVADVLNLYQDGKFSEIYGLGPRRIKEIEVALVFAGLDFPRPTGHLKVSGLRPASERTDAE